MKVYLENGSLIAGYSTLPGGMYRLDHVDNRFFIVEIPSGKNMLGEDGIQSTKIQRKNGTFYSSDEEFFKAVKDFFVKASGNGGGTISNDTARAVTTPSIYTGYLPINTTYVTPSISPNTDFKAVFQFSNKSIRDFGNNGSMQYQGVYERTFNVFFSTSIKSSVNTTTEFNVFVNGSRVNGLGVSKRIRTSMDTVAFFGELTLDPGDTVELYLKVDTASVLTFSRSSLMIEEKAKSEVVDTNMIDDFDAEEGKTYFVSTASKKIVITPPQMAEDGDSFSIVPVNDLTTNNIEFEDYVISTTDNAKTTFTYSSADQKWTLSGGYFIKREFVTIRMGDPGTMDFGISGATAVYWKMDDGTIYDKSGLVPSGKLFRPKLVFNKPGWVKLYCDNFSYARIESGLTGSHLISNLIDFSNATHKLYFSVRGVPNLTGDLSSIKATNTLTIALADKITGDLSSLSAITERIYLYGTTKITSNSSTKNASANNMSFIDCDFSQLEIYNLIKYNYDIGGNSKILNVTGVNAIPNAETQRMIDTMGTPIDQGGRGWSIAQNR